MQERRDIDITEKRFDLKEGGKGKSRNEEAKMAKRLRGLGPGATQTEERRFDMDSE